MPAFKFEFNKDKYLAIARQEGISKALTILHKDVEGWEFQAFEGEKGWQPGLWEEIKKVRDFSRELWELSISGEKLKDK